MHRLRVLEHGSDVLVLQRFAYPERMNIAGVIKIAGLRYFLEPLDQGQKKLGVDLFVGVIQCTARLEHECQQ